MQVSLAEFMQGRENRFALADYALDIAKRLEPEYAEAYIENSRSRSFVLEQGALNGSAYLEESGIRIRLVKNRRLYSFSTNRLDKETVRRLVSRIKKFNGVETALSNEKKIYADCRVKEKEDIDNADILKDLLHIDKSLSSLKHVKYRSMYESAERCETYFLNSEGTSIKSEIPTISLFISFIVGGSGETRQRFMSYGGTGGYEVIDTAEIISDLNKEAGNLHKVIKNGVTLNNTELGKVKNVLISPEICGIAVHESVGHASEADRVFGREAAQAGQSYITGENLGMHLGNECVTIVDEPAVEKSYGFLMYDDEGVRARKKIIIKDGLQNELLTNREYAAFLDRRSNGASRSESYRDEPIIRMSNTYLKLGRSDLDELVGEAKSGIYLKSFTEWNIDDTRTFSRYQGCEAYLIKNGSIGRPVKNYRLESKTLDFWNAVTLVGNDLRLYMGSCGKGEPVQGMRVTMGGPHTLLSFQR